MMNGDMRVLHIAHGHPKLRTGGAELFAYDLFQAEKQAGASAMFLAVVEAGDRERKNGTEFQAIGGPDEMLLWSEGFDAFNLMRRDGLGLLPDLRELLGAFRPDVVHVHHLLGVGVEALFMLRRLLPEAAIVMTLHDYIPICANDGLMVRRDSGDLCERASADACHRCFPEIHQSRFVLRREHLLRHLTLVDRFVLPSRFAALRYLGFGLDPSRFEMIPNARPALRSDVAATRRAPHNVFGFFGNLAAHKGVLVAVDAFNALAGEHDAMLELHGSMRHQPEAFQAEIRDAVAKSGGRIRLAGAYSPEQLPERMAGVDWVLAPSTWWENAPLVVLEAFRQRRPPIVSGIGGLAEMVTDGKNGLHARPNDPASLAAAMGRAVTEPGLWQRLRDEAPQLSAMEEVARRHMALYRDTLGSRAVAA